MRGVKCVGVALIASVGLLASLPSSTTARNVGPDPLRVPQAGHNFPVRPATLRFSYQPPGSYGEEETSGRPLYPPFWITGLGHWESWHTTEPRRGLRAETISHGWLHYDTCDPNCPHGRYAKVRARVKLDDEFECQKRGHFFATFDRVTVTPASGPPRARFIQCTGRVRSGRKSDVIPAGVGFYR